jgi:hypothetical protein
MHDEIAGGERRRVGEEVLLPRRRFGARISRSPRTSCSAMTVRPGASKPASSSRTATWSPFGFTCAAREISVRPVSPSSFRSPTSARRRRPNRSRPRRRGAAATLLDMCRERAEEVGALGLALGREIAARAPARVDHAGAERLGQRHELADRTAGKRGVATPPRRGRGGRAGSACRALAPRVFAPIASTRAAYCSPSVHPSGGAGGVEAVVEGDGRARQVVEDRLEPVVEQRQPVLEALVLAPRRDRLVERIVLSARAEALAVGAAKAGDGVLVEDHLGHRRELDPGHRLGRALGLRVEPARRVEHVAEEVEPYGKLGSRREDVDEPAADREIAGLGHRRRLREAHPREIARRRRHRRAPRLWR